jgi:hypothetical protein
VVDVVAASGEQLSWEQALAWRLRRHHLVERGAVRSKARRRSWRSFSAASSR